VVLVEVVAVTSKESKTIVAGKAGKRGGEVRERERRKEK
jgi:hypothetical protein